jgi:hypothetical protein
VGQHKSGGWIGLVSEGAPQLVHVACRRHFSLAILAVQSVGLRLPSPPGCVWSSLVHVHSMRSSINVLLSCEHQQQCVGVTCWQRKYCCHWSSSSYLTGVSSEPPADRLSHCQSFCRRIQSVCVSTCTRKFAAVTGSFAAVTGSFDLCHVCGCCVTCVACSCTTRHQNRNAHCADCLHCATCAPQKASSAAMRSVWPDEFFAVQ